MADIIDGNAVQLLFNSRTTVGNGDGFYHAGGEALLEVNGTWGGTSFKLQRSRDGKAGSYRDIDASVAFTADGCVVITLPPGWVRGVLTGGTGMIITSALQRIPAA